MPDNDKVEILVTLFKDEPDETRLRLILPGDGWTFDEAKIAKQVSEGMSPKLIEGGLLEGDPDAWLAVLRVSYIRANKEWPAARIQGEDVIALFERLLEVSEEAIRSRPPTNRTSNGSGDPSPTVEAVAELPSSA